MPSGDGKQAVYYISFGSTCCYCPCGGNAEVFASPNTPMPSAGWQKLLDINPVKQSSSSCGAADVIHAQQNKVFQDSQGEWIWTANQWGGAQNRSMGADPVYFAHLQFNTTQVVNGSQVFVPTR